MVVVDAPIRNSATICPSPSFGIRRMTRSAVARVACASMSMMTAFSPAACATATRSSTFSFRDAASSTSTSSGEFGAGPMTLKSRLTSSSENGMYWLASLSTCTSSASSDRPPGRMIFFVITAALGSASATLRARVPLFRTARRTASDTASMFSMLPSAIAPFGNASIA